MTFWTLMAKERAAAVAAALSRDAAASSVDIDVGEINSLPHHPYLSAP